MTDRSRNRTHHTANATAVATLPGRVLPKTGNSALDRWVGAVDSTLDILAGKRTPFDKALNQRDLDARLTALGIGTAPKTSEGVTGGVPVIGPNGVQIVVPFDAFAEELRASKLFADLTRRIDDPTRFNDLHAKVREQLLSDVAQITGQSSASVRELKQEISSQTESVATQLNEVKATVSTAAAGVRQLQFATASRDRATAGLVTTITARLDDFDGGGATVEETMTAIADRATGLEARYTIKVATNGAMAGFGLAATTNGQGNSTSHAIIMADKFAVVGSGDTLGGTGTVGDPYTPPVDRVPFGIDTGNSTIYINGNVRITNGGPKVQNAIKRVTLTAPTDSFILDGRGNASPSSILLTATKLNGLTGTSSWSVIDGTATLTGSGDTRTLTFANLTTDTATIQVSVTEDSVAHTAQYTIKKALDGVRGSVTGTGLFYGISSGSWSANKANRVISNIINGESLTTDLASTSLNSIGDSVTLSNGSSFSDTRYWNGSAWTVPGTIIDGDLLVDGTISATKLSVTTLSAITANLGTITAGDITSTANIDIAGTAKFNGSQTDDSVSTAVVANSGGGTVVGLHAYGSSRGVKGTSSAGIGVFGRGNGSSTTGVNGTVGSNSSSIGVLGDASHSSSVGVKAVHGGSGTALEVVGKMTITSTSVVTNLNADTVDGQHASAFQVAGSYAEYQTSAIVFKGIPANGTGTATYVSTTKPSGTTVNNVWAKVAIGGTDYYFPVWT